MKSKQETDINIVVIDNSVYLHSIKATGATKKQVKTLSKRKVINVFPPERNVK